MLVDELVEVTINVVDTAIQFDNPKRRWRRLFLVALTLVIICGLAYLVFG